MEQLKFYIYDLEVFPNCFTFTGKTLYQNDVKTFEISTRKNQRTELLSWLSYLQNSGMTMVGFNNLGFDYPLLHELLNNPYTFNHVTAYGSCQKIISSQGFGGGVQFKIPFADRIIPQLDLSKMNHFDNANKRTSLKSLQFAMRSASVEDLPFEVGTVLTFEQMDILIKYNVHDVTETEAFLIKNFEAIKMRKDLIDNGVLRGDVLNYSDVKIGSEYLISKIGRAKCFIGSKPIQTKRSIVDFKNVVLPKISFRNDEYQEVVDWFREQKVYPESEEEQTLPKLQKHLANLDFHFGVGGVHASVANKHFSSSETHTIVDIDVSGMYPAVAIANDFYPEHLGKDFNISYKQLQVDRGQYKKGTAMNAVLKLAGNGVFGNSDNHYSPFYDPRYPKQITVNGQLQILQLVEMLEMIPGLNIIQANTDGITVYIPRNIKWLFDFWCKDWMAETGLKLEEVEYRDMWLRDVNNYACITIDGKIKRKGAYWYPTNPEEYSGVWNKDFSCLVVQKVIEQVLTKGWRTEDVVRMMTDPFDFMIRYKTPGGAKVYIGDKEMSKTVRYYVSKKGQPMKKVALPKGKIGQYKRKNKITDEVWNKVLAEIGEDVWDERIHNGKRSKYEEAVTSIESGYLLKECNVASDFDWTDVDFDYYIEHINRLKIG